MFIYIFEDGEVQSSDTGPTQSDFIEIQEGYLTVLVVKFDNMVYEILGDGTDRLLLECSVHVDIDENLEYHVPKRRSHGR